MWINVGASVQFDSYCDGRECFRRGIVRKIRKTKAGLRYWVHPVDEPNRWLLVHEGQIYKECSRRPDH